MTKAEKLLSLVEEAPRRFSKGVFTNGVQFVIHADFYPDNNRMMEVYFTVGGQKGAAAIHVDKILDQKLTIGRVLTEMLYLVVGAVKSIGRDNINEVLIKDEMPNSSRRVEAFTALQKRIAKATYSFPDRPANLGRGMVYRIDLER
jgi:hypothetical protein